MLKNLKKIIDFILSLKLECGCRGCRSKYQEQVIKKCDGKCANCKCGDKKHDH